MATVVSVPLAQQLQVPFIQMRDIYEVREKPSRMYSWTALVTPQILAEVPWNILGSSIFFLCWYWTVGFSTESTRFGYAYLALGVAFPLYYTTIGQVSPLVLYITALVLTCLDTGGLCYVSQRSDRRSVVQLVLLIRAYLVRLPDFPAFRPY